MLFVETVFNDSVVSITIFIRFRKFLPLFRKVLFHDLRRDVTILDFPIKVYDVRIGVSNDFVTANRSIQSNDTCSKKGLDPIGLSQVNP